MGCDCFQIGGPYIAEDPNCPLHGDDGIAGEMEDLREENRRLREFIETVVINYDPRSDIYATELQSLANEALGRCKCCGQEECDDA